MPEHEARRDEKLEALLERLEAGTRAVFQSDNYREMLTTISKFHSYSLRNQILIATQRPDATFVAGFRAWQTKFNRRVMKGQKGIQILGYAPKTITTKQPVKDEHGDPVMKDGEPVMERVRHEIPAYKVMYVFDVSQTEGEPLRLMNVNELEGEVQQFEVLRDTLISLSPVPVVFETIESGAKGTMNFNTNRITVQPDMSQTQTIKTLIHEIAHAQMHGRDVKLSREAKETEAESVAFILCDHLGIDSSAYTFPYLASWSNGQDTTVLMNSLTRIREQALKNMDALDQALAHIPNHSRADVQEVTPKDASTQQEVINGQIQLAREQHHEASRPVRFADRLSAAVRQADEANARRAAGARGPMVQEQELTMNRRN